MLAMRASRSTSLAAMAILVTSGCLYFGAIDRGAVTHTRAAEMTSSTPPLAAFVLRTIIGRVTLDDAQAEIASAAGRESEQAIQRIDTARMLLIDELLRQVGQHRFVPAGAGAAADRVVQAIDDASPQIEHALANAFASLRPWQRVTLERDVSEHFAGWSASWSGGTPANHEWLGSLATPTLADRAILDADAHRTARQWADSLVHDVAANADTLDDATTADLVTRLRAQGQH